MTTYRVTAIQNKPSLLKKMVLGVRIDEKIEQNEKMVKLKKLKQHQDIEFLELGVNDALIKNF
ncbi:MAG: hypothetical protein WC656_08150 [Sulfurimonas sp.]|jgi:hypothetical protein